MINFIQLNYPLLKIIKKNELRNLLQIQPIQSIAMQAGQTDRHKQRQKQKILNKYLSQPEGAKKNEYEIDNQHYLIRDNDDIIRKQVSDYQEDQSSQSNQLKRKAQRRVNSSDDQQPNIQKKVKTEEPERHHSINKKLKKAFGIKRGNQEDNQQDFLNQVKIQGMDQKQIKDYLKKNRKAQLVLQIEGKKDKKEKRKKKKQKKKRHDSSDQIKSSQEQNQKLKKQLFGKSQSSDIQIPQQSRTVYRNKDGTIRNESQQQQKQKRKEMVMQRLAEWEKGMKGPGKKGQGSSGSEQDYQIELAKKQVFDDPMRRWQAQTKQVNPLKCRFEGYANRFNIKPGFRWDGVIRGNGYENKFLQQKNLRKLDQDKKARQYLKNL